MADAHSTASGIADKYVVYGLYDPRTNDLRYIGKTVRGARQRLSGHLCDSVRHGDTHVARWLRTLQREGVRPSVRVLENCLFPEMLGDLERAWIRRAKKSGARLVNSTDGGDGGLLGWKPTEATRAKWKARPNVWKGRKHSPESVRRMSESQRRRWITSPELRSAQSARQKGKTISDDWKRAISAAGKRRWADPSFREKMVEIRRQSETLDHVKVGHQRQALAMTGRRRDPAAIAVVAAKNRRPVVDQHGTTYDSMKSAAETIGVTASSISMAVAGEIDSVRGYRFSLYQPER